MGLETRVLVDGLAFPEAPRWHEEKLWFSDIHAHAVLCVDLEGHLRRVAEVPGRPSGLGWLPDGRALVVSMVDRRLLWLDRGGVTQAVDLSGLAPFDLNDMVIDAQGRAYIGTFGCDLFGGAPPGPADLLLVRPDGQPQIAAGGLMFPNGCVITPDGRTLIVGETFGASLAAFDIDPDGTLSNRRTWAALDQQVTPDGICLDAEGAIWVASPLSGELLRVREGGEVTDCYKHSRPVYACMLGGPDRRTLFLATAETHDPQEAAAKRSGRIEMTRVEVPGAGLP